MATDGKGRMLSVVLTAGNINDTTMMAATLEEIRVPRQGRGRPRTRPERVLADKGYTSKANRTWLADRGIKATIPEKSDQAANRKRKGSAGGHPQTFDSEAHKGRNVVEGGFNRLKNWAGPRHEIGQNRTQLPRRRPARCIARLAKKPASATLP